MRLVIFEDKNVLNLEPITLSRPVFDIRFGKETLLSRFEKFNYQSGSTQLLSLVLESATDEIISELNPQVFHPPSMTINLLVFFIEFINDSYLIGLSCHCFLINY